ncbi:MAG: hypothetical protein M1830_010524 [Pleopsidium flavum]|nr:MAG: hypothetical protein M1830_010524 [Pleopsidium flavum]
MAHPDSDLYPEATGLAKAVVDRHSAPEPLVLYSGWFCPPEIILGDVCRYQYVEVNPYHKPESLLKLNPRGLVPTLQYDNKPLYESTVICEFLEDAYPDHTPKLLPSDPYEKAKLRIWTDFVTSRIIPSFHRFLQFQPEQFSTTVDKVRSDFLENILQFTMEMEKEGPFFLGKDPSLIDFVMAPWAVRLWVFDHYKGGAGVPPPDEGGADEDAWARWRTWLAAVRERKSIKETTSDWENADNTAQSELAKATREGKGVP